MSQTLKFLVGRQFDGQVNSNKSCYFIKNNAMFLINCGHGVVDAMRRTHVLDGITEVYIVITNSSKSHLYDLRKFLFVLKNKKIKPKLIESISLDKNILKKLGLMEDDDYQLLEPLKNNIKWINFLAVPHKNKKFSCPIEIILDGKKIFYGGDAYNIPFAIAQYDEYYFDFSDKKDEYALDVDKIKNIIKKNKIKRNKLWLVHLQNVQALEIARKIGMQVAQEEERKFTRITTSKKPIIKKPIMTNYKQNIQSKEQ